MSLNKSPRLPSNWEFLEPTLPGEGLVRLVPVPVARAGLTKISRRSPLELGGGSILLNPQTPAVPFEMPKGESQVAQTSQLDPQEGTWFQRRWR